MFKSENHPFAYLSAEELYIISPGGESKFVDSSFARETAENAQARQKRHSWKGSSDAGAFDSWGSSKYDHWKEHKAKFVSVTQGEDRDLLHYLLKLPNAIGLFKYTISSEKELRVFHTNHADINGISFHPNEDVLVGSFANEDQAHIGKIPSNSLDIDLLTDGDVYDSAPSWDISEPNTIYYQSCGIGRNQDGHFVGVSPVIVNRLNIETGEHETLCEDEKVDYLAPKVDQEGNLYFIQRPYGHSHLRESWYEALYNLLMIPFRFIKGLISIVEAIAKMLNPQPMAKLGPNIENKGEDRYLEIKGTNIDLRKLKKDASKDGAIVPNTWKLVMLDSSGVEHVIASSVIEFDVSPEGSLLFSNGYKIFEITNGKKKQIFKSSSIIDEVKWLG